MKVVINLTVLLTKKNALVCANHYPLLVTSLVNVKVQYFIRESKVCIPLCGQNFHYSFQAFLLKLVSQSILLFSILIIILQHTQLNASNKSTIQVQDPCKYLNFNTWFPESHSIATLLIGNCRFFSNEDLTSLIKNKIMVTRGLQ